jgi:lactoylglutathione lyase
MANARAIGINHVALEVGDVDEALEFYARLFEFSIRERSDEHALICMGDQVLALFKGSAAEARPDGRRHVGIVVTDRGAVASALELEHGDRLDVLDPWGNHVQVVDYAECRFRKATRSAQGPWPRQPEEIAGSPSRARAGGPCASGRP